ncbi:hypothetical protein DFJ73DRAFT_760265 [Zopfochytrium polystomum]|nr:hypothetical protein DFJ73DRAFT_760265 [Zopfochytrium polystomum]
MGWWLKQQQHHHATTTAGSTPATVTATTMTTAPSPTADKNTTSSPTPAAAIAQITTPLLLSSSSSSSSKPSGAGPRKSSGSPSSPSPRSRKGRTNPDGGHHLFSSLLPQTSSSPSTTPQSPPSPQTASAPLPGLLTVVTGPPPSLLPPSAQQHSASSSLPSRDHQVAFDSRSVQTSLAVSTSPVGSTAARSSSSAFSPPSLPASGTADLSSTAASSASPSWPSIPSPPRSRSRMLTRSASARSSARHPSLGSAEMGPPTPLDATHATASTFSFFHMLVHHSGSHRTRHHHQAHGIDEHTEPHARDTRTRATWMSTSSQDVMQGRRHHRSHSSRRSSSSSRADSRSNSLNSPLVDPTPQQVLNHDSSDDLLHATAVTVPSVFNLHWPLPRPKSVAEDNLAQQSTTAAATAASRSPQRRWSFSIRLPRRDPSTSSRGNRRDSAVSLPHHSAEDSSDGESHLAGASGGKLFKSSRRRSRQSKQSNPSSPRSASPATPSSMDELPDSLASGSVSSQTWSAAGTHFLQASPRPQNVGGGMVIRAPNSVSVVPPLAQVYSTSSRRPVSTSNLSALAPPLDAPLQESFRAPRNRERPASATPSSPTSPTQMSFLRKASAAPDPFPSLSGRAHRASTQTAAARLRRGSEPALKTVAAFCSAVQSRVPRDVPRDVPGRSNHRAASGLADSSSTQSTGTTIPALPGGQHTPASAPGSDPPTLTLSPPSDDPRFSSRSGAARGAIQDGAGAIAQGSASSVSSPGSRSGVPPALRKRTVAFHLHQESGVNALPAAAEARPPQNHHHSLPRDGAHRAHRHSQLPRFPSAPVLLGGSSTVSAAAARGACRVCGPGGSSLCKRGAGVWRRYCSPARPRNP